MEKKRPRIRWMDNIELNLRHMAVKKMQNKSFGQKRVGVMKEALRGL